MKKKNHRKLGEIINGLSDLEVLMAQHAHYEGNASPEKLLKWFSRLQPLTSELDKVWKDEEKSIKKGC